MTLTTAKPDATVIDKNASVPSVDPSGAKKVATSADGTYSLVTTMDVGDIAYFKITFNAVNYVVKDGAATQIKEYTVTDTPDGFSIDRNSVAVQVGSTALDASAYSASLSADGVLTVHNNSLYASPSEVTVSYTATLTNKNIADKSTNTASISYDGTNIPDIPVVEVYNYTVKIDKYKEGNENTKLSGAQFVLKNSDGKFYSVNASTGVVSWVDTEENATVVTTDESGAATFSGLAAGTYSLKETKAPDGYNLLSDEVEVTLNPISNTVTDPSILTVTTQVSNSSGTQLPSTGGMGTTLLYAVGVILVLGAGILLVVRRRMGASR